ncbi:hypothetical protein K4K56_002080 [Colletotrichum sp. SAR 10_98]|nr:hypothetical protein K4K56_002080 [Colletotrichum sp. SAR 10_98]
MAAPKFAGIGKMDQKKMRKQMREMARQGAFKVTDLPQTVSEECEAVDESGGVRLNGISFTAHSDKFQDKASSDLNPASTPWLPNGSKADNNDEKVNGQVSRNQSLNGMTSGSHSGATYQDGEIDEDQDKPDIVSQVSSPATTTLPPSVYNNSQIMSGLQFAPGHWAAPQQNDPVSTSSVATGGHLSGSASMGNLLYHTPTRQNNALGVHLSHGGNRATLDTVVSSPVGNDTPTASNLGLMTEPRNFAPRVTDNFAHLGMPPKFTLKSADGNPTTPADSHDPFAAQASQGGPVQMPLFGSQYNATQMFMNGQASFGTPTGETLNFDNLPRDDQSANSMGPSLQPSVNNGGHAQNAQVHNVQNVPLQHILDNGNVTTPQGSTQSYTSQGELVPYQVGYPPRNIAPQTVVTPYLAPPEAPPTDYIRSQRSPQLNRLTGTLTGFPSVETALNHVNFPFIEPANRPGNSVVRGVVKIGNIPFVTNRSEIIAVLGRNSRILNDTEEPVHIIMERVTGKTTDAYVEFHTLEDATKAVEKHQQNLSRGRVTRIGQRPVEIELSSQSALMKDLFPSSRGVFWNGCNPQVLPDNAQEPWENFKGFVSNEEMTMLVKHVEVPHRSPFSKECPQRPFECLISTLTKFPWHMKTHITVQQRHAMHKATCDLLRILVSSIRDHRDEVNLTQRLLKRVVAAAMRCEGFSATQKDDVAYLVDMEEMEQRSFGQPRFAESWRHLYVLVPKNGVPLDVIEWYISVIRDETNRFLELQPFQEKCQTRAVGDATDGYFGYFWRELNHPVGPVFDTMTLAQLASHEYQTMESIIRRALITADVHHRSALPGIAAH